jgi:2-desacetyl-2-hydroxyethyl bacteriochlorophyllide A dehydrogenase
VKSLVWTAPEKMEFKETDIPEPGADEVLIEVKAVGICGSEIEGYRGHNSLRVPPLVMGHEFSGIIRRLGSQVETEGKKEETLRPGQRVTVNPLTFCGKCMRCQKGLVNLCDHRSIIGIHRPGAFAEYVVVPAQNVHVVPDETDFQRAALTEPLACSLRAARRALDIHPLANVVVIGAGAIGLLSAMACRLLGAAHVTILDTNDARLETALNIGVNAAFNPNKGDVKAYIARTCGEDAVDVVIDAAGFQPTRAMAIDLLHPGGTFMNIGLGIDDTVLPINRAIRSEIRMLGSFCYDQVDFHEAKKLLLSGKINHEGWTEARPLSEGPQAFKQLVEGSVSSGKIILTL